MPASEIFKKYPSRMVRYQFALVARTLVGGIPSDPDVVHKWIEAKLKTGDARIAALAEETIEQTGWRTDSPSSSELEAVVEAVAKTVTSINTFKRVDGQLVWEGRCMKAALVEAAHACYPGNTFPKDARPDGISKQKGFKSWFTEVVEVLDQYFPLGRSEPDIAGEVRIKHINGPRGPQSIVPVVDIVTDVKISGTLQVMDDKIPQHVWKEIWEYVETGGLGADRARGDGRCTLEHWRKVDD